MSLDLFFQYLFAGITYGSIYAIVAIGFNIIYNTTGMDKLKQKMLSFGNRKNLLADYDQAEHFQDGFYIYRLY